MRAEFVADSFEVRLRSAVLVAGMVLPWAASSASSAQETGIYWTNGGDKAIGHANLDGTGVNGNFISGADGAAGLAVDQKFLYWSTGFTKTIARAKLDGTDVNLTFITGIPVTLAVAVDRTYIYWGPNCECLNGAIARARLDGTAVNESFLDIGSSTTPSIAVDDAFIYWALGATIGRAKLDGTQVNESFISGLSDFLRPIAVDGTYIYWTDNNQGQYTIGRAKLDGTGVNRQFIGFDVLNGLGLAVAVPEPKTYAMILVGLVLIGAISAKTRR